jgi:hypothetical protein
MGMIPDDSPKETPASVCRQPLGIRIRIYITNFQNRRMATIILEFSDLNQISNII